LSTVVLRHATPNVDANAVSDPGSDHGCTHVVAEREPEQLSVLHGAVHISDIVADLADHDS
jgi:hypothetical protein